jgi:phosphoglycerol transferase
VTDESPTVERRRRRAWLSPTVRTEAAWVAGTVAVTGAAVVLVLQLWQANPRVPFAYSGDVNVNATIIKGIVETGWYQRIPNLGAPAGYDMHDFPLGGDNLQWALVKGLTFLSHDWALVLNAYYLLTFALVSAVSYLVLRRLGLARWLALGLATIYSLLPYHFIPGEHHLLLSGYLVVPLGAFLVLTVFDGGFGDPSAGAGRRPWILPAALCVLIGTGGAYYAFFTVLLLGVAAGMALLAKATRRGALHGAALMGLIVVVASLNNVPSLLYWRAHGHNDQVAQRSLGESDLYALHIVDLVLPVDHHRVPPLADLKAKRDTGAVISALAGAQNSPLGVAAASGLGLSLLAAAAMAVNAGFGPRLGAARRRFGQLAVLNVTCMLFATVGGFSMLVALAGVLSIRVWARIVVFIAFFSLVALGLAITAGIDAVQRWLAARSSEDGAARRLRRATMIGAPVLLALAVLDQTTPAMVPPYAANRDAFTSDRGFVQEVERRMPKGAAIFQLPIISYPEQPPVVNMNDYDLVRAYLHSKDLRWSYGAMRGRPADWTPDLAGRPLEEMLDRVTAAGFEGLYIDRFGFVDHASALEAQVSALAGPASVFSRDGRLSFFDLRSWSRQQRDRLGADATAELGRLVLHPVTARWGDGFFPLSFAPATNGTGDALYYPEQPGQSTLRHGRVDATVEFTNPLATPRPVNLVFSLASSTGAPGQLTVSGGGAPIVLPLVAAGRQVTLPITLPPGTTTLTLHSTAPPEPTSHASFRLDNFRIDDARPPAFAPR